MISAKAFGVYLYLVATNAPISADRLSEVFQESRKPMLAALKELRNLGLIRTTKKRIGRCWYTISELGEFPVGSSETALLIQQCKPNSQLAYNPYSLITYCISSFANSRTSVREKEETRVIGLDMTSWGGVFEGGSSMDKDEALLESAKASKRKQEEFETNKANVVKKNNLYRSNIPVVDWLPKHVCQEFSNRIWTMHIKPWNVNASQFVKAMGTTRRKYGTNGEVEMKVMDAFFVRIDLGKYSDPEHLWRLFLKMFPQLLHDAKMLIELPKVNKENSEVEDKFWAKRGM